MFKALDKRNGEEIVILDPKWERQIDLLRSRDRRDALVCQGCKQPVRVRAGQIRRWHFAHKHLENCPYGYASPTLLETRAILYKWLADKFGEAVTVEKRLDDDLFPRPIDCWVDKETGDIAYWIVESGMKPEKRDNLKMGFQQLKAHVNWVFVADVLREDGDRASYIHLTTTERELMQQSVYDEITQGSHFMPGKSLHYLDPVSKILTTFRGLRLVHEPQLYAGHKVSHEISRVLVSPGTGEFVHPGEYEQLQAYQQKKQRLEEKRHEKEKRRALELKELSGRISMPRVVSPPATSWPQESATEPTHVAPYYEIVEATCMICGNKTKDWWYIDNATKQCKCRDCLRQGKT